MTNVRLYLTLMSKDNSDKIIGFLINKGLKIKASGGSGLVVTGGDNDELSCLMALDIEMSANIEEKVVKKLKEKNEEKDCNTMPSYISDELRTFLKDNNINYFSCAVQNVSEYGATWNGGNVKKSNAKDVRKLRQEEKEDEE